MRNANSSSPALVNRQRILLCVFGFNRLPWVIMFQLDKFLHELGIASNSLPAVAGKNW
jgi:hypothetical protein